MVRMSNDSNLIQAETVMGTCTICKQQIRMIKDNAQVERKGLAYDNPLQ